MRRAGRSSSRSWTSKRRRPPPTFQRFTDPARQVVVHAQDEARTLRHNHVGTEHILLGLLREEGVAARTLRELGIELPAVRGQVVAVVGEGDEVAPAGRIPFTPRAKRVLELSLREAMSLGHDHIGTEHLLLGLARENDGVAMQIVRDLGTDDETLRQAVVGALGAGAPRGFARVASRRRGRSPLLLVVTTWVLGAVTLGAGILIGWAIWG